MQKFWTDRTALTFAAAGIVLMALTIAWRINPVEGSVVPRFLRDNPFGIAVFWMLFVACMPAFLAVMVLVRDGNVSWLPDWIPVWHVSLLLLQGMVYFMIGKAVSAWTRRDPR
jgi:hypothetical protein